MSDTIWLLGEVAFESRALWIVRRAVIVHDMTSSSCPPKRRLRSAVALAALALLVPALLPPPIADAAVGRPASAWDFNGDGYGDLAAGAPGDAVHGRGNAGAVTVALGGPAGLTRGGRTWTQDSVGVVGKAHAAARFGEALASGDFDRDGHADLAVASPGTLPDGTGGPGRGEVTILFGSGSGLTAQRDRRLTSPDPGIDRGFGTRLVAADFDGDGYGDLAVSAPVCRPVPGTRCRVLVYLGARGGLAATPDVVLEDGADTQRRWFGWTMTAGDLDGDGRDELVVGSTREQGLLADARVDVFAGGSAGPVRTRRTFRQSGAGIALPGVTFGGTFGWALTTGDLDGDGDDELVIGDLDGSPPGTRGCADRASCPGLVLVLQGSDDGVTVRGREVWWARRSGVPGSNMATSFSQSLAAGDIDGDGRDDLAVGAPAAGDPDGRYGLGAVVVLRGSSSGLTSRGAQRWSQDSAGVPGRSENEDYLGRSVRLVDLGRGRGADLVAGVSEEDIGAAQNAGTVTIIYSNGSRLSGRGAKSFDQDTPRVQGLAEPGDGFGVL